MAGALKGITIEIGGDTTKLGNALKKVQTQANSLQGELRGINSMMKHDPKNATLIAQKYTVLGNAIKASSEKLQKLQQTQDDIDAGKVEATEDQYRDLQREIQMTERRIQELQREQAQYASTSAVQLQAIGKEWQDQGERIVAMGQKLMPVTVAIAAVGVASSAAAIQFESSFAGVRKTVDATEEEFEQLAEASREMALNKPVDVNDVNTIMALAGQLGIAKDNLAGFAGVVADLDVATDLDIESASTNIAQFSNITNMAQGDADRFGSTLVALGNTSATTESSIMNMAMRVGAAGTQIGMSQDQILGLSAALSSVGIEAEAGGTAISTVMSTIDKEVATNGDTLKTWADVAGMSVEQFKSAWQNDAAGALQAVIRGLGDASAGGENLNLILQDLGITSIRQTDMMKRLSNASGVMTKSMNTASTAWQENVALTNEAEQRYQTTESQLIMLKNRIVDAGISIGQGMQPALVGLLNIITPVAEGIGSLAKGYAEMDPPARNVVTTMGLMAAGAGPLLMITGKMTSGAGKLVEGLGKVSAAFAAKAAAQAVDTAATTANTTATTRATLVETLRDLKANVAAATAARKAAATTADTAATTANTIATGAQTVATNAATVAQVAFNTAMKANPIGTVVMAVGALVAGLALLGSALSSTTDDTDDLTLASQEQEQAMKNAEEEYKRICEEQGENSEAAIKAKAALDEETAAFEASKQTVGQFCESVDKAVESHDQLMESLDSTTENANNSAGAILNMSDELAALASNENKSAEDKARLTALVESLNASCEGLNITYDENTDKLNMNAEAIEKVAKAEADRIRGAAAMENYKQLIEDEVDLTDKLTKAKEELVAEGLEVENMTREEALAQKEYTTSSEHGQSVINGMTEKQKELVNAYYDSKEALDENTTSQAEAIQTMTETITKQHAVEQALAAVENGTMDAAEAAEYYSEATGQKITADEIQEAAATKAAEAELEKASAIAETTTALQEYIAESPRFEAVMEANGISVDQLAERMANAGVSVEELTSAIEEHADKTQNAFEKIEENGEISLDEMLSNLEHNTEVTNNWSNNVASLYAKAGSDSERQFISYIASMGVEYAPLVDELNNDTTGKLTELANAWAKGGDSAKIAALAEMGLLKEGMITETGELTEEAERILEENAGDIGAAGAEGGVQYTEELKNAIAQCPTEVQQYIDQLEAQLKANGIEIGATGATTGNKYSNSLASAISKCPAEVQAYITQLENQLRSNGIEIEGIGGTTGTGYGSNMADGIGNQAGSVQSNAAALRMSAMNGTSLMPTDGTNAGSGFGSGMTGGIGGYIGSVYSASARLRAQAQSGTSGMNGIGSSAGSGFGSSMAGGIGGQYNNVYGEASSLADAAKAAKDYGDPRSWGEHLGENFASGISSMWQTVSDAASSLASAVAKKLKHTIPEEGILSEGGKGEAVWGEHLVENFSGGIVAAIPKAEASVNVLASKVKDAMAFEVQPDIGADYSSIERGVQSTFGVDIDQASLDALQLNAASTAKRLDAVITTLEAMAAKLQPNYQVVLDTGVVAGAMTPAIDKNLGTIQRRRATGL